MKITLSQISESEKLILKNLFSLYLHDLSEFTDGLQLSSDGSFEFDSFEMIWEKEGVTPYFIKRESKIMGFLLLLERPFLTKEYDYCINDFFLLRKFRGRGVSKSALEELLEQKKGKYFLIVLEENRAAVSFWRRSLNELNTDFKEEKKVIDEEECLIITFRS